MDSALLRALFRGTRESCPEFPADNLPLYTRLFWGWLALRTAVWTVVSCLVNFNIPKDTAEMLSWGREWCWGYHKHPPLPAWVAEGAAFLSGGSIWGVYLASQMIIGVCFWAVWRLGREMLSPRAAFFAALSLEGLIYYTLMANDIDHGVLLAGTSALTTWCFYRALRSPYSCSWLPLGIAMGFTLLSKYSAGFLFLPMLLFLIFHPAGRGWWQRLGPYLAAGTALLISLPHVVWCCQHDFGPIRYFLERSTEKGLSWTRHLWFPLYFTLGQGWRLLPVLLILAPLTGWRWRRRQLAPEETFNRDFLLVIVSGPFLLHLLVSLALGVELRDMWGYHLWTFTGLVVLFFVQTRSTVWNFAWSGRLALRVSVVFLTYALVQSRLAPAFGLVYQPHLPAEPVAQLVQERWQQHFQRPVPIIASADYFLASSVCWYLPERPAMCMLDGQRETPWAEDDDVNTKGGVILWDILRKGERLPADLRQRFPRALVVPAAIVPYHLAPQREPLHVGIALVPPLNHTSRDPEGAVPLPDGRGS